MRTDAEGVQTNCSAVGEASEAWCTASHLVGRVQACPLTSAQSGIAVCDRPHVLDYCYLLWAMLETGLPTTAPAGPRNGVDTHSVRSSQALGNRELTVCPSLACVLFPYSGGAKERAPTIHVAGQVWPPIALSLNHRSVREPGPSLALS
jgi:hypothetical protein